MALRDGMLERHGRIMSEDRIADTRRYALAEWVSQPPRGDTHRGWPSLSHRRLRGASRTGAAPGCVGKAYP